MKVKLFFIMLFAVGIISCTGKKQNENYVRTVKVIAPELRSDKLKKEFSGVVKGAMDIDLGFSIAGKIKNISVKEGDYVRKGDVLARLESEDYALGVEALQIQYDQLSDEVERMKTLYDNKCMSGNDYEKAVAGLEQLGVQLQVNKKKLDYTILKSPVSGYIGTVNYNEAEMVNAGTPVFSIVADGLKRIDFDIPLNLYMKLDSIDNIFCTDNDSNGQISELKIVSVSPKADNNQMFKVTADIVSGPAKSLLPGMNVNVLIQVSCGSGVDGFILPIHTVFEDNGKSYVWTVDNNIVNKKSVVIDGLSADGLYVVRGNLDLNDKIVAAGVNSLNEGDSVRIIGAVSKTNIGGLL